MQQRFAQQIQFILEIDKLKQVLRQTLLTDASRQENSAEHSWHLAVMAMLLIEYAPVPVDVLRVMKMVLIHDLVEIDAGDTFCYDMQANQLKAAREIQAAERIFGLLPLAQGAEMRSLWEEFEAQQTPEAQFATALDRLQPFLHNQQTQGATWRIHHITRDQVKQRMQPIANAMPEISAFVDQAIEACVAAGYLKIGAEADNL